MPYGKCDHETMILRWEACEWDITRFIESLEGLHFWYSEHLGLEFGSLVMYSSLGLALVSSLVVWKGLVMD